MSMNRDADFMSIALDLARLGLGKTSPNPAVGCVIVKKGKILAVGFHKQAGMPHAEIEALRTVCRGAINRAPTRLRGATLYVNLEPCCHFGRTPPCTDAIIRSGIKTIVVGMRDPDPKVNGKGIRKLKVAGVKVRVGVLKKECQRLNEAYVVHRKEKRPFVILKMATTPSGMVGWRGRGKINSLLQVTGREAQRYSHGVRDEVDAILVGIGTVLADDPQLTTRLPHRRGRDPLRVVLDSALQIPLSARLLHVKSPTGTIIMTAVGGRRRKQGELERLGVEVLRCPKDPRGGLSLNTVLRRLAERGIMTLLVEGGPHVWSSFLKRKLVDRVLLFVGVGKRHSVPSRHLIEAPFEDLSSLQTISVRRLGRDLLIEGTPKMGS